MTLRSGQGSQRALKYNPIADDAESLGWPDSIGVGGRIGRDLR